MCFVHDYEWTASIHEESTSPCTEPKTQCEECHAIIPIGEPVHRMFMQEHEECQLCENGYCDCPRIDDWSEKVCADGYCRCEKPDFGEVFDYQRCDQCDKFIQAIKAAEIEAGCSPYEAVPALGMMQEDITNGGKDEAKKYFVKALRMFPELKASGYLGKLAGGIFG